MTRFHARWVVVAALTLFAAACSQPKSRADCERDYKPELGQEGKDAIWEPTPDEIVTRMLTMANVTPRDYVIDLGAGDGKIAIAASKQFGAASLGIEYNPDMVKFAECMVRVEGVARRTRIIQGDIFREDFSKATVITMYLWPQLNRCLRHRILAMKPGTRVVSHRFNMGDWSRDEAAGFKWRRAYLWIVPARVGGRWSFRDAGGGAQFDVDIDQTFQKISGVATVDGAKQPLAEAALRGDAIRFAFQDAGGIARAFSGTVRGNEMAGRLSGPGAGDIAVTGVLRGPLKQAAWADMLPDCGRFYGN